jgi:hypothetical protein
LEQEGTVSEPIKPAMSDKEWAELIENGFGPDGFIQIPYPDEGAEHYGKPHALAAQCLFKQDFGFTREDVEMLRYLADNGYSAGFTKREDELRAASLAARIEALLHPEP